MPAEFGRGASGFTNILTRSGLDSIHGSIFEFLRNSSLDARNYFDYSSPVNPGRIPPFKRNEFGFTNGGPVLIPHVYDGRGKLFYYLEYQGFRQVQGTTQVFAVPTQQQEWGLIRRLLPAIRLPYPSTRRFPMFLHVILCRTSLKVHLVSIPTRPPRR